MFPEVYTRYFDVPQNYVDDIGGNFYRNELLELVKGLEELGGKKITDEALRNSIEVYNENRRLVRRTLCFPRQRAMESTCFRCLFAYTCRAFGAS